MRDYYLKFIYFIFFTLITFSGALVASECNWFVFGSSGSLDDDFAYGTTTGQVAIGGIRGRYEIGNSTTGYWYNQLIPEICLEIDTEDWYMDSISVDETRSMISGEQITVFNCGNCNQNYGLEFIESSPLLWTAGYSNSLERFILRAVFTQEIIPPTVYDASNDFIKDILTWSHGREFGEEGYNVPASLNRYLWFQFVSPTGSEIYGENQLTIMLYCQANMP